MIVISDSAALIGFSLIGELDLLRQLYGIVIVPEMVYQEVVIQGSNRPNVQAVANSRWIQVKAISQPAEAAQLRNLFNLDAGESEAIVLAIELNADLILLDDNKARRYARQRQLRVTGMIGVLLAAKQQGLIVQVRPSLDALISAGIFIGDSLYQEACQLAGE